VASEGPKVVRFIETHLPFGPGDYMGQPVRLRDWQKGIIDDLYELDGAGDRRFRHGLIGLPKGAAKSSLAAMLAVYELFARDDAVVPVAAASYEQSAVIFDVCHAMVTESPTLSGLVEAYESEIKLRGAAGRLFKVAAVGPTNEGMLPTFAVFDELHELIGNKERMHLVISNGLAKRRNTMGLAISTAGVAGRDSLVERLYARGRAGTDPRFFFHWREASDRWDLRDVEQRRQAVLEAHPAAGDWVDLETLVARYDEIPEHEWRRYFLNQFVSADVDSWLADKPGAWAACAGDASIPAGAEVFVGIDVSLRRDSTAAVVVWPRPDGRYVVESKVWTPPEGGVIDHQAIMGHLRQLASTYSVREFDYDPRFFEVPAQILLDEGLPMVEFPQSVERLAPACGQAYELIVAGRVVHGGDRVLADHVNSAVRREGERGWTLSKSKSGRQIDACIAMVMGLARAAAPATYESKYETEDFLVL
jgi:phage terminase large subunit-like protein